MKQALLAVVVAASLSQQTAPPPPPPPKPQDPVQQMQQIDRAKAALDVLQKQVEVMAAASRYKCMNTLGSAPFCDCLIENLPIAVDFLTYVRINTSTPEELGYAALNAENKKLVDDSIAVRDKCVAKVFPPKSH